MLEIAGYRVKDTVASEFFQVLLPFLALCNICITITPLSVGGDCV